MVATNTNGMVAASEAKHSHPFKRALTWLSSLFSMNQTHGVITKKKNKELSSLLCSMPDVPRLFIMRILRACVVLRELDSFRVELVR